MKKKVIFFSACLFLMCTNVRAYSAVAIMDADSNRILYSVNENSRYLIASTTKIMTTLVVLSYANLDDIVTAGDEITGAYGSSIYLKPKERMTVRDLLYGLMLRSGNDAALVLAKHTAGSIEGFVKLMNDTALSIGMLDTTFENPHGLDEENENMSTVHDLCLLMSEAMKNEEFRRITSTKEYSVKTNFGSYDWYNKNRLIFDYKYATGGKIGYTTRARHTFVSSATKDGKNLIITTFVDADRFDTHKKLYEEYFNKYKKYILINKDNLGISYKKGYKVYTTSDFSMLLKKDEIDKVKKEVELYENVKESKETKVIGTISITLDNKIIKKLNLYARELTKDEKGFWGFLKGLFKW